MGLSWLTFMAELLLKHGLNSLRVEWCSRVLCHVAG